MISKRRDCRRRKCTTVLHGSGRKKGLKRRWFDRVRDDIKEKGLSEEEVYDRATWKRKKERIKEEMVRQSEG